MKEQLELFNRAQAEFILIRARSEVFDQWQKEIERGERKPPSAEAFITVTHAINGIHK